MVREGHPESGVATDDASPRSLPHSLRAHRLHAKTQNTRSLHDLRVSPVPLVPVRLLQQHFELESFVLDRTAPIHRPYQERDQV